MEIILNEGIIVEQHKPGSPGLLQSCCLCVTYKICPLLRTGLMGAWCTETGFPLYFCHRITMFREGQKSYFYFSHHLCQLSFVSTLQWLPCESKWTSVCQGWASVTNMWRQRTHEKKVLWYSLATEVGTACTRKTVTTSTWQNQENLSRETGDKLETRLDSVACAFNPKH